MGRRFGEGYAVLTRAVLNLLAALMLLASGALAQEDTPPALVADNIRYDAALDALIATGNVEVFFGNQRLTAKQITYDNRTGNISAEGPLVLHDESGAVLLASQAELTPELESGLLFGARLILAQNFQIAAVEARKLDARHTVFERTIASACQICNRSDVPLWLIRANRIIQDEEKKQIHLEGARFEVFGVTVAYFPYFRMPDPSVRRASGFLTPEFRNSDIFGLGARIPYFIVIDQHRDVTITPFFTTKGATILEGEFRQRFANGELDVAGAIAGDDDPNLPSLRAYLDLDGRFRLPDDLELSLDIAWTADRAFLSEYGYSQADRLTSEISLTRQRPESFFSLSGVGFQSLRDGVNNRTLPVVLPELDYQTYWTDDITGGRITTRVSALGLTRQSGRDVYSLGAGANWRRSLALPGGVQGTLHAGVDGRAYVVQDDVAYASSAFATATPTLALELWWPVAKTTGRAVHVVEPVAQFVYSDTFGDRSRVPNEDSLQVEFDAANLFSFNRFPGYDKVETGLRANVGVNYTRLDPSGWNLGLTFGQVFRSEAQTGFPTATGLNDISSNIVAAANIDFPPILRLSNQTLLSNSLAFERNDIQLELNFEKFELDASYVYLAPDATAGAPNLRQEVNLATRYQATPNWAMDLEWRRDLTADNNVSGLLGVEYGNECIRGRFSVSRRFTNSNTLPSSTEFGLTISLAGLGGATDTWPAHGCVGG